MAWNREQITCAARASARADYGAFEAIGLSEIEDARVLDVGCFDGFNTVTKFAPYHNIACVVGIDPFEDALRHTCEIEADERFSFQLASLEDFAATYEGQPFDVVYMSHTFQHLPDKAQALQQIMKLLSDGGYVVIKTVDDSAKLSYPDPDDVVKRICALYEQWVRPNVAHTRNTDRNNGGKCYTLLTQAGYADVRIQIYHGGTQGKTLQERLDLFERLTYFRKRVPECAGDEVREEMAQLLARWREMFTHDDYFFDSPTFMAIARKPFAADMSSSGESCVHSVDEPCRNEAPSACGSWTIAPMTEDDLGDVMAIETRSFSNPWTPLAYAMELRHNHDAHYVVARTDGIVGGYIGWWCREDYAVITHVAVDRAHRRCGVGKTLVTYACAHAQACGCTHMRLLVRKANEGARAFYRSLGFEEVGTSEHYYTDPDDDGIAMIKPLDAARAQAPA